MLILIAGITGFIGVPCAKAALSRGHSVRGLARDASRVPREIFDKLDSFEAMSSYYDIPALDRAVAGVDAIINTMPSVPESIMEGQLLLIRAAERAGVKIYHSTTFNYDWTLGAGTNELYDDWRHFAHHVELSSTIKPIYMFTGAIAEWYFRKSPYDWNSKSKTFSFYGPATSSTRYTTANDVASFVLEAISAPDASNGGYIRVQSFEASPDDVVKAYNAARDGRVTAELNCLGTLEDAKAHLDNGRATHPKRECYKYTWYIYQYHIPKRTWDYQPVDVARFSTVKQTSLEDFFRQNPDI